MRGSFIAVMAACAVLGAATVWSANGRTSDRNALRAPADFAGITDSKARSVALFTEMGKVIQHPRCLNCHPRTDSPTQGEAMTRHDPPVTRGKDGHGAVAMQCSTCHHDANFAPSGVPGAPHWALAPRSMAWQGETLGAICRQIKDRRRNGGKTLDQLVEHNGHDALVGWGWKPGGDRVPAPGTQAQFGELTRAWVDSGAYCPA